jgi:hypothetical protein
MKLIPAKSSATGPSTRTLEEWQQLYDKAVEQHRVVPYLNGTFAIWEGNVLVRYRAVGVLV